MPIDGVGPIVTSSTKLAGGTSDAFSKPVYNEMPIDAISSSVASSIQLTFKIADFILKVQAASKEISVFAKLIKRVQQDREEALYERQTNDKILVLHPGKLEWVDRALCDIDDALEVIGKIIEDARIDTAKGKKVTLKHKFEWVLTHKSEFIEQQRYLTTCHISLGFVLSYMHGLAFGVAIVSDIAPAEQVRPEDDGEDRPIPLRGTATRRPRPRPAPVLPHISPGDTEPLLSDIWEKFSTVSPDNDSITQAPWTDIGEPDLLKAAQEALDTTLGEPNALLSSLQSSTLHIRRRRRESALSSDDNSDDQAAGNIGAVVRTEVERMSAASVARRESLVSRSRKVASHFST